MTTPDRERALEKVRKLLAMANDGRGNINEAEMAAKQAAALMTKYNIDAAEAQLQDLMGDEPDLAQEFADAGYYHPTTMATVKSIPKWVGMLAVGIANLTQVKVDGAKLPTGQTRVRFSGYATDVVFAKWLLPILCRAVYNEALNQFGDDSRQAREAFRHFAASQIQARLFAMRKEQDQGLQSMGSGTALAVIDRKAQAIAKAFGEQYVRKIARRQTTCVDAAQAGRQFGNQVNIPAARPLSGTTVNPQLR